MDVSDDVLNVVIDHQKCLQPVEVYRGLQQGNVRPVQFIPLVTRWLRSSDRRIGYV